MPAKSIHLPLLLVIFLFSFLLPSCAHDRTLKSESGLYNVELEKTYKIPVSGAWFSGTGSKYAGQKTGAIFIAPLNVQAIVAEYPDESVTMKKEMESFVAAALDVSLRDLNQSNNVFWCQTLNPAAADIRVDMAVVDFKPQRPFLRGLIDLLSFWSPVPMTSTLAAPITSGDICLEMTIRDARTGELLMALKDENSAKARYYRADAYSSSGNATANLRAWSHKLARIIREAANDRSGGKTLRQRLEETDLLDAAGMRANKLSDDIFS